MISFVYEALHVAFECGGATIADIFACLWLTKVVSCFLASSAITNVGE